jgi:oleate hydratase
MAVLRDGQRLQLPAPIESLVERTDIRELLRQYGLIGELDEDRITVAVRKGPPPGMTVL